MSFRFDVHALFFSEDAVTLENELHKHFQDRAVNAVNQRKEFFFASPSEVRNVLIDKLGNLLESSEVAETLEYFQSSKYWPATSKNSSRKRDIAHERRFSCLGTESLVYAAKVCNPLFVKDETNGPKGSVPPPIPFSLQEKFSNHHT